jgi:hypothetical protein
MNLSLAQTDHLLDHSTTTINLSHNATTVLSMFSGLAAFEILNYATTAFALQGLLGSFTVMGFNLVTWLAAAVCCLDVSGIIYLFLPLKDPSLSKNNSRLFIAWLLVTGLNAWLIWLGICQVISIRHTQISLVIDAGYLVQILPVFIVFLVWFIRILLIGAFWNPRSGMDMTVIRKEDQISPDQSSILQTRLPFDLLPHGTENQYEPIHACNPDTTDMREPTYRGIPVRYRTS